MGRGPERSRLAEACTTFRREHLLFSPLQQQSAPHREPTNHPLLFYELLIDTRYNQASEKPGHRSRTNVEVRHSTLAVRVLNSPKQSAEFPSWLLSKILPRPQWTRPQHTLSTSSLPRLLHLCRHGHKSPFHSFLAFSVSQQAYKVLGAPASDSG